MIYPQKSSAGSRTGLKVTLQSNGMAKKKYFKNQESVCLDDIQRRISFIMKASQDLTRVPFCPPVARYHGDAGVDLAYVASVGVSPAVAAQPGSGAAAVPHQKEAKDGGNIQAQRGGEEADGSGGVGKTRSASAATQGRTPHMIPCVERLRHCRIHALSFLVAIIFLFRTGSPQSTVLRCHFSFYHSAQHGHLLLTSTARGT